MQRATLDLGSRIGIGITLKKGKSYYSAVGAIVVSYAEREQGFWRGNTTKHILNVCGRNRDRYDKNREHILNQKLRRQQAAYKAYLERNRIKSGITSWLGIIKNANLIQLTHFDTV